MKRVLVTGAGGFIGRQTIDPLIRRGFEVHRVRSHAVERGVEADENLHMADLHAPGAAERLIAELEPTHLLHLAWYAEPGRFWTSTENLRWVESSLRLLRAFAEHGGRRAVLAGTCAEYDWATRTVCAEGSTALAPATLYGASKHGLRLIAERHAAQTGYSLGWGRVFFVFGPGESTRRLGGSVASALVQGRAAPCSHGEQLRDFLASPDLGDAFAALLDSTVAGPVNLGSGRPLRIRELVTALGEASGRPELIELGAVPASPGEPEELTAEVTRLREEVGWTSAATLAERARETIAWWRAQPVASGGAAPAAPSARASAR